MKTPDQPEKPGRVESSYHMDAEVAIDILKEIIIDEGKVVFEAFWDSGGPGAGADSEYVFKYRYLYWPGSSVYGVYGPFNSLVSWQRKGGLNMAQILKLQARI